MAERPRRGFPRGHAAPLRLPALLLPASGSGRRNKPPRAMRFESPSRRVRAARDAHEDQSGFRRRNDPLRQLVLILQQSYRSSHLATSGSSELLCITYGRAQLKLCQHCIGHLRRAGRALADCISASRYSHHVVSSDLAFPHHAGNRLTNTPSLFDFTDVLEHHDGRQKYSNWIHDWRIELGILGRRAMGWLEDGNPVSDVSGRRKAQPADQAGESIRDYVAEQI